MTKTLLELADYLRQTQPSFIENAEILHNELIIHAAGDNIIPLAAFLRDDSQCQFTQLVDICGVDYLHRPKRFDVVYNLLSVKLNQRIRIKVQTDEETPVPSITGVFSTAGWFEREAWDMYGIYFSGNPDLRRILTDYGFDGHPQRKDFPLTGFVELRYDPERRRVAYSAVKLPQAYRTFDFMSPWEGAEYILPGDEKAKVS
jgi:NADH-quinone oxidoreductase subunit C